MLSPRRFWSLRRIEHGPGQPELVSDHCVINLIHSLSLGLILILILITDPDESYRVTPSHARACRPPNLELRSQLRALGLSDLASQTFTTPKGRSSSPPLRKG